MATKNVYLVVKMVVEEGSELDGPEVGDTLQEIINSGIDIINSGIEAGDDQLGARGLTQTRVLAGHCEDDGGPMRDELAALAACVDVGIEGCPDESTARLAESAWKKLALRAIS